MIPASLLYSALMNVDVPWIANLITAAGLITTAYVGGNKLRSAFEVKNNDV